MKITLEAWAERTFDQSSTIPTLHTWYVDETAQYSADQVTPAAMQIGGVSERLARIFMTAA